MAPDDPLPSAAPGAPLCPSTTTPEEGTAARSTVPSANWTSTVAAPAPTWASTQVAGAPSAAPISPTCTSTSAPVAPPKSGSEAVPTAAVSETSTVSCVVVTQPNCVRFGCSPTGPVTGPGEVPDTGLDTGPEEAPEPAPDATPPEGGETTPGTLGVGTGADPPAPAGWSNTVICTPSGEVWPKTRCNDADAAGATSMGAVVVGLDSVGAPDTPGVAVPLKDGVGAIPIPCSPWVTWSPGLDAVTVPASGRTSTPSRRSR